MNFRALFVFFRPPQMIPRHVPALALGTLALGVAEFSMMSILLPVADDLGVTVPEAGEACEVAEAYKQALIH